MSTRWKVKLAMAERWVRAAEAANEFPPAPAGAGLNRAATKPILGDGVGHGPGEGARYEADVKAVDDAASISASLGPQRSALAAAAEKPARTHLPLSRGGA